MRIISGQLSGRQFDSPKGHRTHPMSDKARGGLFSVLGDISGLSVLDSFAGSGAVGLEAISRGAKHVQAIDKDKDAFETIRSNAESLGISGKVKVTKASFGSWSDRNIEQKFDLVIADPPYSHIPYNEVAKLIRHLKPSGTLVLSWPAKLEPIKLEGLNVVRAKAYGDAQLVFYQKIS